MRPWTDERVEELLSDTFRDHEKLADPDRAVRLSAEPSRPKRRWPAIVAAAAAVALVAGGTSYVLGRSGDTALPDLPATSPTRPTSTGGDSTDANVAATRDMSAWLLHAVPMPPGSREWSGSPNEHYREPAMRVGPSDAEFTRTTWWTVPLTADNFRSWLEGHQPEGLRLQADEGPSMSRGQREDNAVFEAEGTDTWTPAFVVFSYTEHDDDALAVRVDTFIGARFARTTFVPNDTTRVTIVRTYDASENPERTEATVTDPRQIAGLVALVNNLPGSMTGEFVASCPASLFEIDYRVRFDSPQSTSVLRFQPACWAQATLRTDGTDTEPTLDPGPRFTKALDLHLG